MGRALSLQLCHQLLKATWRREKAGEAAQQRVGTGWRSRWRECDGTGRGGGGGEALTAAPPLMVGLTHYFIPFWKQALPSKNYAINRLQLAATQRQDLSRCILFDLFTLFHFLLVVVSITPTTIPTK